MLTIGYGLPDPYMKGCWEGAVVITVQCQINLLLSAILIGVIFQGFSRPQSRACTIVLSQKAVIRRMDGVYYLQFRVADLRVQHALIEAHVRCYCLVRHPRRGFEMLPMRLEVPDDALGSQLLLTLPTVVTHRIDAWSPLVVHSEEHPAWQAPTAGPKADEGEPRLGSSAASGVSEAQAFWPGRARDLRRLGSAAWPRPGLWQRQADAETGCRSSCFCPTCGEAFVTVALLAQHSRYAAALDAAAGICSENRHRELSEQEQKQVAHQDPTREEIAARLRRSYVEVVVILEGIEPTTSSTVQARHSYVVGAPPGVEAPDVEWDMGFVECCSLSTAQDSTASRRRGLAVDLSRFHDLEPCLPGDGAA